MVKKAHNTRQYAEIITLLVTLLQGGQSFCKSKYLGARDSSWQEESAFLRPLCHSVTFRNTINVCLFMFLPLQKISSHS